MSKKIIARKHCMQPPHVKREFDPGIAAHRLGFIMTTLLKWANGTEIKFIFIEGAEPQKNVVRSAFKKWKNLGIGISFKEVAAIDDAMVRIGFDYSQGSWSYVGRDILTIPKSQRTMNFGWDLTADDYGMTTAIHEIGHTIGFEHEHQSPFAGITWNTETVYKTFGGSPNFWPKDQVDANIINKLTSNKVQGSPWDPDSIMEYQFDAGLILQPAAYVNGVFPPGTLSPKDIAGVRAYYPLIKAASIVKLEHNKSAPVKAATGGQDNYVFKAPSTRKYTFQTVGEIDTVMVISEKAKNENHYLAGDDDSGLNKNAKIRLPLVKGREYLVNVKVTYSPGDNSGSVIVA